MNCKFKFLLLLICCGLNLLSQDENKCNCLGNILFYCTPADNFSHNQWAKTIIGSESNVPNFQVWPFEQWLVVETSRLSPDSKLICGNNTIHGVCLGLGSRSPTTFNSTDQLSSLKIMDVPLASYNDAPLFIRYLVNNFSSQSFAETDIYLNPTYCPTYNLIGNVTQMNTNVVDGKTLLRHELGHFYGAEHDDIGTLMEENLFPGDIKDIDCDLQDAYDQVYMGLANSCPIKKNRNLCPNTIEKPLFTFNIDYSVKYKNKLLNIEIFNNNIKSIIIYNNDEKFNEFPICKLKSKIKLNLIKNVFYQIRYKNESLTPIYKLVDKSIKSI